ncbi:hypothetical protein Hdeb2414_s0453g00897181 [Helianthus debilis subsp. tardiflorus]
MKNRQIIDQENIAILPRIATTQLRPCILPLTRRKTVGNSKTIKPCFPATRLVKPDRS